MRILLAALLLAATASAQTDLSVRGAGRLFPVAVPQLCLRNPGSDANTAIPKTISRDLEISGFFEVLNSNAYIETAGKCGDVTYSDWSVIGAEGLVRGVVDRGPSGLRVELRLHDVQRRAVVLAKEYNGDESLVPQMAHKFANEIMRFFTGEYGVFGTQIAYSQKVGRFKELAVMDMDGSNMRQLTKENGLALSVSWSPRGNELLYTSYRNRIPDLFRIDLSSKRSSQITRGPAMELGGKFTADAERVVVSRSDGSTSSILMLNRDGSLVRELTRSPGMIDVSPSLSPDGTRIAFCSNRGGGPQIYVMNSDGSAPRRISFVSSTYCTSPAWAPKGGKIAFVCRADRGFNLFVADEDGSNPLQLTSIGNNEDPTWAPNGQYIAFATTFGRGGAFNIALMKPDGTNVQQLTNTKQGATQPAWGPQLY